MSVVFYDTTLDQTSFERIEADINFPFFQLKRKVPDVVRNLMLVGNRNLNWVSGQRPHVALRDGVSTLPVFSL